MTRAARFRTIPALALAGLIFGAVPAAAQNAFGDLMPMPGQQPGFQQPGFQQPGFQQPGFQQQPGLQQPAVPGFNPQAQVPGFNPNAPQTPGFDPNAAQPNANDPMAQMFAQLEQYERQDFGVQPTPMLHAGAMHGATPTSIPGGALITTRELVGLVQSGQPYLIFDVLGGQQTLPGAVQMVAAHQPGDFNDQLQQQLGPYLQQVTGGNPGVPLVFYCASTECWMSYNAALRAINLGYTQVKWYRGGIAAWQQAGLPMMQAGMMPQQ